MNNSIKTKKSLGQHFLNANWVLSHILNSAEINPKDIVVEIGPGRGKLTKELSKLAGSVKCVELDQELLSYLNTIFPENSNVEIIHGDARTVDISSLVGSNEYKLVANLPYYAAMPIIMSFVESHNSPKSIVVMVQDEVARNLTALPGKLSIPAVILQNFGVVTYVKRIPPSAFKPSPKIFSAIIKIELFDSPKIDNENQQMFFNLIKKGFSSKRKKLYNNIAKSFDIEKTVFQNMLIKYNIDKDSRAESLTFDNWKNLYLSIKTNGYQSNV